MLRVTLTGLKKATAVGALSVLACTSASAGWFGGLCGQQSQRPYYDPSCEPNWGVQETNWRRFPSSGQYGQGSYCPDGGCQPSMDASYMSGPAGAQLQPHAGAIATPALRNVPSAGATAQPLIIQTPPQQPQMQVPSQGYSAAPTMAPVFEAPAPAIPYGMSQPAMNAAPMMGAPMQMQNQAPLMAPMPTNNATPAPQPMGGQRMMPTNPTPSNGGSSNPVPMPMESLPLPPMPGANNTNQYQSPFNNVSYPAYQNQPMTMDANYGQTNQMPAGVPVRNISYSGQPQQKSSNPFSAISKMWSRRK